MAREPIQINEIPGTSNFQRSQTIQEKTKKEFLEGGEKESEPDIFADERSKKLEPQTQS